MGMRGPFFQTFCKALLLPLAFVFLTGFTPTVGQRVELTANRNMRSSAQFSGKSANVLFTAAKGLQGDVTDVVTFPSGNYGIQVKITSGHDTKGRRHEGEAVWIYYEKSSKRGRSDPGEKYLSLKDQNNEKVTGDEIPEKAASAETLNLDVPVTEAPVHARLFVHPEAASQEPAEVAAPVEDEAAICDGKCADNRASQLTQLVEAATSALGPMLQSSEPPAPAPTAKRASVDYSSRPEVKKMIDYALRHRNPQGKKLGLPFVKDALQVSGMTEGKLKSNKTSELAGELTDHGFTNLLNQPGSAKLKTNPNLAPKGAIMIYGSRGQGSHVEIKTGNKGKGGYVSYKYQEAADAPDAPGSQLLGVYIQ